LPYNPEWELLANALKRVMAVGTEEQEAKADICNAISDRKIAVRVLVDEADRDVGGQTLYAPDVEVPLRLKPEDLDWRRSRPLAPWPIGPHSVVEDYLPTWSWRPRKIALLELSRADVVSVLSLGTSSDAVIVLSPGPKSGEREAASVAWEIAEQILANDGRRPRRRHGRQRALARAIQPLLRARGYSREVDTITKDIRPGLREWEAKNPDK
jgi:hypothetical protein